MATEKVKVKAKLTREYLFHNPADDILSGEKKVKTGTDTPGNDPTEWQKSYTATKTGQLYIKPEQIFSCMREGGKRIKKGKGNLRNEVAATVQVVEPRILLDKHVNGETIPVNDFEAPLYIDKRPVKNPSTRGLNMRYRLAVPAGTEFEFHLTYDNTILSEVQVKSALKDGGSLIGIGDGRSIGKGRFEISKFEKSSSK